MLEDIREMIEKLTDSELIIVAVIFATEIERRRVEVVKKGENVPC